jgi:hypothetical protein
MLLLFARWFLGPSNANLNLGFFEDATTALEAASNILYIISNRLLHVVMS